MLLTKSQDEIQNPQHMTQPQLPEVTREEAEEIQERVRGIRQQYMVQYRACQRKEREEEARRVGQSAETRTGSEILTLIVKGEGKCSDFTALHNLPGMRGRYERFYTSLEDYKTTQWYNCPYFRERGPHVRRATRSEVQD